MEVNNLKPVMDPLFLHGEQEVTPEEINNMFITVFSDIETLNNSFCNVTADIKSFMENVKKDLEDVENTILKEKERQQDLNILCSNYSDFDLVVNLTPDDFEGNFSSDGKVFLMESSNNTAEAISIESITGNGFEGNKYVYNNGIFQQEVIDTSNRNFITDNSNITIYEYSRITADTTEKVIPPDVNMDSIDAICAVIIKSKTLINTVKILSDSSELKLVSIEVSNDGSIYKKVNKETYDIKNKFNKYNVSNYIPDSGIVCFPDTYYVKLVFQSSGYNLDTIAFYKTVIE